MHFHKHTQTHKIICLTISGKKANLHNCIPNMLVLLIYNQSSTE